MVFCLRPPPELILFQSPDLLIRLFTLRRPAIGLRVVIASSALDRVLSTPVVRQMILLVLDVPRKDITLGARRCNRLDSGTNERKSVGEGEGRKVSERKEMKRGSGKTNVPFLARVARFLALMDSRFALCKT